MLNKKVKKLLSCVCTILTLWHTPFPVLCAEDLSEAESAILIEGNSGNVLYQRNADEKLPMASTTKIMTALTALKYKDSEEIFTVPKQAVGCEGTSAYLEEGEKYTLRDLLIALMLQSANDSAVAIATNVAGDIESFCVLMNQYAKDLGLKNTHFQNPHGLPADDHYTTARELAQIALEAHKNPVLSSIIKTKNATVKSLDGKTRSYSNHNKLLFSYKGANGVKTGYTKKSGRCLVSSAERDGLLLIAVTLSSRNDWKEHSSMLDFGFSNYESVKCSDICGSRILPVVKDDTESFVSLICENKSVTLKKGDIERLTVRYSHPRFLYSPVRSNLHIGEAAIYLDGAELYRVKLLTEHSA